MPPTPPSPVSEEVGIELQRVVERWSQLPLDQALSHAAPVLALVQSLADGVAEASGSASSLVPDLGPSALMDQLTVMVHDASVGRPVSTPETSPPYPSPAGEGSAPGTSRVAAPTLAAVLASLRRELA